MESRILVGVLMVELLAGASAAALRFHKPFSEFSGGWAFTTAFLTSFGFMLTFALAMKFLISADGEK